MFALADQRLDLRAMLGISFQKDSLGRAISYSDRYSESILRDQLQAPGWHIRVMDGFEREHFLLVDREVALISNPGQRTGEGTLVLVEDPNEIVSIDRRFTEEWSRHAAPKLLYSPFDNVLTAESADPLIVLSESKWNSIIGVLARNPKLMYRLEPRDFEELIAELLSREGLKVKLTPSSRDGGRDIMAFAETAIGQHLYYVECKRYAPDNPIDVRLVRQLYGVVEADRATAGLLVTTSRFTKDAKAFGECVSSRLSLREYDHLTSWLAKHSKSNI
jgi:HJR/Mrr/RecB family endonuclease